MSILGWAAVFLGLMGAYLNIKKKKIGFIFWSAGNIIQIILAIALHSYYNCILFAAYIALNFYGLKEWSEK
jgi:hypothetical protein